jgi:hypothetical protein
MPKNESEIEVRNWRRRNWRGDLNRIPVEIAYDFELCYIIENNAADGFHGSRTRIAAARRELNARRAAARSTG